MSPSSKSGAVSASEFSSSIVSSILLLKVTGGCFLVLIFFFLVFSVLWYLCPYFGLAGANAF